MSRGDNASVLRVRVIQRNSVELKIHQAGKPPGQVASFPLADSWIFFFLSVQRVCVAVRHGERWRFPAAWSRTRRRELKDSPENTRML